MGIRRPPIEERIADLAKSQAPSLVPTPQTPAPPPKVIEEVPELGSLVTPIKDRLEIIRLASRSAELAAQIAPLDKERKGVTNRLKQLVGSYKIGKAIAGDYRISYFSSARTKVDLKVLRLLLSSHLSRLVIDEIFIKATTTEDSYTLRISEVREEEEPQEEESLSA